MTDDKRPNPDELLSRIQAEEKKSTRGRLKIFFGSSAGVGKTYAMLKAAREEMEQGRNVLVGIAETHNRPETDALLEGLRILQPLEIRYRGMTLRELDIDTALTRKPDILLVDELAHTNAPGSRHPKRWNDVVELLNAGIDVFTTLNVQHIESLNDIVAATTGVWVKETVPDTIFDMAEDIVLMDIDEDDLIKRLHEGKVYIAPGAMARAAENFFKKGNLSALREMALRRTADRVDAERETLTKAEHGIALADKLVAFVEPTAISTTLIRATKRLATGLKAPWIAVYFEKSDKRPSPTALRELTKLEEMIVRLGGKFVTLRGDNALDELLTFAHREHATKVIVGRENGSAWRHYKHNLFIDRVIRRSGHIDVYVVTSDDPNIAMASEEKSSLLSNLRPFDYFLALTTVAGFTIPGLLMPNVLTGTDQALLYLTGIVMVAERLGLGPSLFYAFLTPFAFHLFFLNPHKSLFLDERPYIVTLLVMIVTGYAIATQASRLRAQAIAARDKEKRTKDLYDLTRKLAGTRGRFAVSEIVTNHIASIMDVDVTVWMTNDEGHPAAVIGDLPSASYYKELGALQWCYDNAQSAGRNTATMPSAAGVYMPLTTSTGTIGVLGVTPHNPDVFLSAEELSTLEALSGLLASALERVRAGEITRHIMVQKEGERLRERFVAAVTEQIETSPDVGAPTSSTPPAPAQRLTLSPDAMRDISQAFGNQNARLSRHIRRFLTTVPSDTTELQLNRRPCSLADRVERVLQRLSDVMSELTIENRLSHNLPDVSVDLPMFEQAIANVFESIASTSPLKARLGLSVESAGRALTLKIVQERSTIPGGVNPELLDRYVPGEESESQINLTVAAGIVRLHGGTISAENHPDGQITYKITLPTA